MRAKRLEGYVEAYVEAAVIGRKRCKSEFGRR
jgi:hypothetical protein